MSDHKETTQHATRPQFEDATWVHYQGLKARGWSAPEEGDPNSRESLFWLEPNGQYGVRSVEAAWRGWQMREAALRPLPENRIEDLCEDVGFTHWSEWDGAEFQAMWVRLVRLVEAAHGINTQPVSQNA